MMRHAIIFIFSAVLVEAAKQQVQLSDSYLPVAMQVLAHLTDQMAFETKDDPAPTKPTTKPPTPNKPLSEPMPTKPGAWPGFGTKPTSKPPTFKPTTAKPYVQADYAWKPQNGWWMSYGSLARVLTTPFHTPGLFAPVSPPKPSDRISPNAKSGFLPPFDHNTQYTVIEPHKKRTEEPLLAIEDEEVKPLMEPAKDSPLLPPHFESEVSSRSDGYEDFNEENLQYLSANVRDLIRMAHDPDDERVVDVWEGVRANNQEITPKGKLSSANLRLLLLYDLLSREAKRQRLSDYSGFSPDVMRALVESSSGGAPAQLRFALSKMVERKDCAHEYANNRAKEMVQELAKDESKLTHELRYLQPLVYKY